MPSSIDITAYINSLQKDYIPGAQQAARMAVARFGDYILGEAQELCPQSPTNEFIEGKRGHQIKNPRFTGHSGFLRSSATAEDPVEDNGNISVTIGFNTTYAAAVHERLNVFHAVGQAKYLEQPLKAEAGKLGDYVLAELKKEFG